MPLRFIRNDITKVRTDAIVLPANKVLEQGDGASRSIYRAASEQKLKGELSVSYDNKCEIGKAVATYGYDLGHGVKYIIHAVCPQWLGGEYGEAEFLYSAYREALILAKKKKCTSIAFPLLSTGSYQFPRLEAIKIAVNAILDFLTTNEMDVYLVFFGRDGMRDGSRFFGDIESFIDDDYADAIDDTYPGPEQRRRLKEGDDWYGQKEVFKTLQKAPIKTPPLGRLLRKAESAETFHEMFLRLTARSELSDPEIYKKARLTKQHYSKIKQNPEGIPKKETILAIAFALELTTKETSEFLMKAGYSFCDSSAYDVIVKYCLDRRITDLHEVNELLRGAWLDDRTFKHK